MSIISFKQAIVLRFLGETARVNVLKIHWFVSKVKYSSEIHKYAIFVSSSGM